MGSDTLLEVAPDIKEPIAVSIVGRLTARFAIGARAEEAADMSERLARGEKLKWATSNPKQLEKNAEIQGYGIDDVFCMGGSVEAALDDIPDLDLVFDIVDSGKSMRANNLEIIQDNVAAIALIGICRQSVLSQQD